MPITTENSFSPTEPEFGNMNLREQLLQSLDSSEDYRQAFVEEKIRTGIAAQIKTIRERYPMKQAEFAKVLGKSQSWVSRLEDPNEPAPTVATLLLIASKLDIGLEVRFAPFSDLLDDITLLSPDTLNVPRFRNDRRLFPRKEPLAEYTTNLATAIGTDVETMETIQTNVIMINHFFGRIHRHAATKLGQVQHVQAGGSYGR